MKGKYKNIPLDRIVDPEQPLRSDLSPESVADLTASIKQIGIIEPLIVMEKGDLFEVIAGHRRLVAAGIAGLTEAPCIIVKAKGLQSEMLKLHENLNRDNINPIDWANHLSYLKQHHKLSTAKISEALGMSENWVLQHLAILDYDPLLLEALHQEQIAFSAARELNQIRDPEKRKIYINHAVRGGVTSTLAIKWRKEANRESVQETPPTPQEPPVNSEPQSNNSNPVCPVCGEEIAPGDMITLQVHDSCKPQATE